jgi:hypothetical protein
MIVPSGISTSFFTGRVGGCQTFTYFTDARNQQMNPSMTASPQIFIFPGRLFKVIPRMVPFQWNNLNLLTRWELCYRLSLPPMEEA